MKFYYRNKLLAGSCLVILHIKGIGRQKYRVYERDIPASTRLAGDCAVTAGETYNAEATLPNPNAGVLKPEDDDEQL